MELFLTLLFIAFIWALAKGSPRARLRRMEKRMKYLEERERKREKQEKEQDDDDDHIMYF